MPGSLEYKNNPEIKVKLPDLKTAYKEFVSSITALPKNSSVEELKKASVRSEERKETINQLKSNGRGMLKSFANNAGNAEFGLKLTGYAFALATGNPEIASVLGGIGEVAGDLQLGVNSVIDVNDGKIGKVGTNFAIKGIFAGTGKGIENLGNLGKLSKSDMGILQFINDSWNSLANYISDKVSEKQTNK